MRLWFLIKLQPTLDSTFAYRSSHVDLFLRVIFRFKRYQGHLVNALALRGDEGRDTLR